MKSYEITITGEGRSNTYIIQDWSEGNARSCAQVFAEQDFDEVDEITVNEI